MKAIYKNRLILFFLILAFFKPICFQYYSSTQLIDTFYDVFKMIAGALVIFDRFMRDIPKIKLYKSYVVIFVFGLWGVISTFINNGFISRAVIDLGTVYALYILVSTAVRVDGIKLLHVLKSVFLVLVILQLISEIIYPTGMPADLYLNNSRNPLFFVTLDNGTSSLTIVTVAVLHLTKLVVKKSFNKKVEWFYFAICLLTAFLSGSTTAAICTLMAFLMPILISEVHRHSTLDKPVTWITGYILLFVLVIFGGSNSIVSVLFGGLTGKMGFTGRTFLWDKALKLIADSPLIGYGRQTRNYIEAWGGYFSSHNVVLEAFLQGGIIEVVLWLFCIAFSARKLRFCNDKYIARLLLSIMFIVLLSLMMEVTVYSVYLFIILALMNSSQYLHKSNA